jgi:hypothetical protein
MNTKKSEKCCFKVLFDVLRNCDLQKKENLDHCLGFEVKAAGEICGHWTFGMLPVALSSSPVAN